MNRSKPESGIDFAQMTSPLAQVQPSEQVSPTPNHVLNPNFADEDRSFDDNDDDSVGQEHSMQMPIDKFVNNCI